jgi:hypothetical protein
MKYNYERSNGNEKSLAVRSPWVKLNMELTGKSTLHSSASSVELLQSDYCIARIWINEEKY